MHRISDMTGGWFVGDFLPSVLRNREIEVGVKYYAAGATEPKHVHRKATEITVVVEGRVRMAGCVVGKGGMIMLEPGEPSAFEALEDSALVVVKHPSVPGDKYPA